MKKIFFLAILSLLTFVAPQAADFYTVAEIIEVYNNLGLSSGASSSDTYTIRGYVTKWKNGYPTYQNGDFFIDDSENGSTSLLECFRLTASNSADKRELSKGEYVEVTGKLKNYNGRAEVCDGSFKVLEGEAWEPIPISISEFISLNDGKRYILTGVVTEIASTEYGNLYIEDNSGSIYVFSLKNSNGGSLDFETLDLAETDTLTISAIFQIYNGTGEAINGRYISHSKYVEPKPDPDPDPTSVDFASVFANGWDQWIGKTVTFSNDFVYCDTYNNTIAPHRLRNPEEYGEEGTDAYYAAIAKNTNDSCKLMSYTINWQKYRTGTLIRGLKAYIPAANQLQAVETPQLINNELPTERPEFEGARLLVCGANIENFFVDNVESGAKTAEALAIQTKKIGSALAHINADIYALCEIEEGTSALQTLVDYLGGDSEYGFVGANSSPYNATMIGFIYKKATVEPYGNIQIPNSSFGYSFKFREAIQCFKEKSTGEKFNLSMNHFYAKISKTDADREKNMADLISKLTSSSVTNNDPDILVMGDLNAYSAEEAVLKLKRDKNYVDLLMKYDPEGYSHLFGHTAGFLDHAYCTPSMEEQVTKAVSYHLNADTPKSLYSYSKGNDSMYRYADHDPILVGLKLGSSQQGVENVAVEGAAHKELRNGQIVIVRGDNVYTITGERL